MDASISNSVYQFDPHARELVVEPPVTCNDECITIGLSHSEYVGDMFKLLLTPSSTATGCVMKASARTSVLDSALTEDDLHRNGVRDVNLPLLIGAGSATHCRTLRKNLPRGPEVFKSRSNNSECKRTKEEPRKKQVIHWLVCKK